MYVYIEAVQDMYDMMHKISGATYYLFDRAKRGKSVCPLINVCFGQPISKMCISLEGFKFLKSEKNYGGKNIDA